MGLHQLLGRQASDSLESVDVLRVVAHEESLVVQQFRKVVTRSGLELAGVQLSRQSEERLRVSDEVLDVKDRCRVWQIVLLEVVVQASGWRPEVRDSSGCEIKGNS